MASFSNLFLFSILWLNDSVFSVQLSCRDQSNQDVDWWFIWRMPYGLEFAYLDSNMAPDEQLWVEPGSAVNCTNVNSCALYSTMKPILGKRKDLLRFLHNDEFPHGGPKWTPWDYGIGGGHEKGVLAANSDSGFWIIHSITHWPDVEWNQTTFWWPVQANLYGQSMLCVSLDVTNINVAASQMTYMFPSNFSSYVPPALASIYPQAKKLLDGERHNGSHMAEIYSRNGQKFLHFAKSNNWGGDIFDDWVSPYYGTGFVWNTWRKGYWLPSLCPPLKPFQNLNALSLRLQPNISFEWWIEHAKWGISHEGNIVCTSGLNRMQAQRRRGGAAMCWTHPPLWRALQQSVAAVEPCCEPSVQSCNLTYAGKLPPAVDSNGTTPISRISIDRPDGRGDP